MLLFLCLALLAAALPAAGEEPGEAPLPEAVPAAGEEPAEPIPAETDPSAGDEPAEPLLPEAYKDYRLVTQSGTWALYLYEPTLSLALQHRESGVVLASTLNEHTAQGKLNKTWTGYTYSGVVLDVLTGSSKNYKQADLVRDEHTLTCTDTEHGFTAEVYFTEYGAGFTLEVSLEGEHGDELLVRIPDKSIREDIEGVYIATVSLCPMLGATYMDTQAGYMLVPDGAGALIRLTNKEERFPTGYSQLIYGTDAGFTERGAANYLWDEYETTVSPHQVILPVYGMAHTEEGAGFLGYVEQGETRCSIEAHPNGAMRIGYNRCFAKFLLRDVYKQPLNQSGSTKMDMVEKDRTHHDLAVRFFLLAGDQADYTGMAVRCREYLLATGRVTPRDTAYRTRIDFIGSDREKFLVGTRPVVMTTAEEAEAILRELRSLGVASSLVVYRGWQNGGLYGLPVSSYSADGAIGGNEAVRRLHAEIGRMGGQLFLYADALRMNASATAFTYDAAKMVNKTTLKEESRKPVYPLFYYLLPEKSAEKLKSLAQDLRKNGISGLAVGGITDHLFSYTARDAYFSRDDGEAAGRGALEAAAGTVSLALEEPFACQWAFMSAFLNMPLDGSDYMYIDEEVPFLPMVLKGVVPMYADYVNFEANKTEFFLRMAETGVYPSFCLTMADASALIYTNSNSLYSTQYAAWRDTAAAYDRALRPLAEATGDAVIVRHEKLGDLRRVTYSNGVVVLVNYGAQEAADGSVSVPPLSWTVTKAGENP